MGRFFAFGDSWCRGDGVNTEHSFPYIISNKLDYKTESFINLGISGNTNGLIRRQVMNMKFEKDDFIFIVWTSPHRDEANTLYSRDKYFMNEDIISLEIFPQHIKDVEEYLDGHGYNYVMTHSFNPIFGYDYKLEVDVDGKNFIEWGKPNNTLIDIITENWCKDNNRNRWMNKDNPVRPDFDFNNDVFQIDGHPSEVGHKMIAEKLLTYMRKK